MLTLLLTSLLAPLAQAQDLSGALTLSEDEPADVYTIQDGDTLWDIASLNMGNPYYWARLWSINNYITNPHWIYPGSTVIFTPGTLLEPPQMDLEEPEDDEGDGYTVPALEFGSAEVDCGPNIRFVSTLASATYMTPSFLADKGELEVLGELFASQSGMIHLSEGDLVYLRMVDIDDVECGDVFAVVKESAKVKHPELRRLKYGRLYQINGEVRVIHKEGDVATAYVRRSFAAAERGDLIIPLSPIAAEMPVKPPRGDLEGTIVARQAQEKNRLAADGEVVYIDRGREDGLRIGNSFFIVRRQDASEGLHHHDPDIPIQVVGRVVVTRIDDYSATGVVVNASFPVEVGDHLAQMIE